LAPPDRDRKELLRTLLEEVIFDLKRAERMAHLTLRWRGSAITLLDVPVPRFRPMGPRTDEDTISLLRRLAALYPDEVIAGILNRHGHRSAHRPLRMPRVSSFNIAAPVMMPSSSAATSSSSTWDIPAALLLDSFIPLFHFQGIYRVGTSSLSVRRSSLCLVFP